VADKMKRRKNLYFGLGPAPTPTKRERARSRKEFQAGVQRKRREFKGQRERESSTLFKQLQKDAKPQRAHKARMSPGDEERWRELLRSNPGLPELVAFAEQLKGAPMAKKRKRKKNRRPRKGVMPAGLKAYWAKKRRAKNARKAKRRKRPNPKPRKRKRARRRRNIYFDRRSMGFKMGKKPRARRRKRRNPPRRRKPRILKPPAGMGPQRFAKLLRKAGVRVRIIKK